ncbi:septum site-determining protein MinC [Achromobacter mucicolens]|jgi:septum site-determining protein MinC|uniref:Probable septum site-determining protein MinC n=2 Tax=Achromobacter mucicolens TaxID=1389922 RepID=A0ABM8LDK0_9BURK|nr:MULTISPECIES: septum site-determining protein MinC [Achromobacter]KRB12748.1 septum formation inhibitor [Achromobacter sp. Root170]MCP2516446.1 septum site-determining protein MinC [Achromobacter mucicolens]MDG9971292.1 septum site-determining protein MinC [Achromobacter mucicolens]UDG76601.1 septum site-determining protein MinC [Achromobacter sp. 77]WGJ91532.1 septum site-determining protein MinC [Achromobacter mucicolens]
MNTESLALDFKSATLYAIRVVLHSADPERLNAALAKRMADAGSFFENEPVVIDASRVEEKIDWTALVAALRGHNLPPIGVVAEGANLQAAREAGLTPVELSTPAARPAPVVDTAPPNDVATPVPSVPAAAVEIAPAPTDTSAQAAPAPASDAAAQDKPAADEAADAQAAAPAPDADPLPARAASSTTSASSPTAAAPHSSSALVITRPLRSGQRVYARHTDLVVIGMVSQGAEVIADGNVHVYGPLRGKAMAGARGDTSARIFTTHLDAELLAVAGVYRVVEDKLDRTLQNQPALVRLDGDTLRIEALKA